MTEDSSGCVAGAADLPEPAPATSDLTVAAIEQLMRNGAIALGHPLFERYRAGWFNALGMLAGMLDHDDLAAVGYALGDDDADGDVVYERAVAVFGDPAGWPRERGGWRQHPTTF